MLSVSNLSVQFGKRVLFDEVNTTFNNGNCYGHVSNPIRSFASLLNQFFELKFLIDGCSDEFVNDWCDKLPLIVSDLNMRLSLNSEYRGAIEKIFSKQLTKKR